VANYISHFSDPNEMKDLGALSNWTMLCDLCAAEGGERRRRSKWL